MTTHSPLPVAGYKAQSTETVDTVNAYKRQEERLLRSLDKLAENPDIDKRWLAIGRTDLEKAFMAINRSVFKPGRVSLPEDAIEYKGYSVGLIEAAAEAAHESNRAIQEAFGEDVAPIWKDAPEYMRESTIVGVKAIIDNPAITPEELHDSWSKERIAAGWVYGEKKDEALKTHHCLVPYDQLPEFQQEKDHQFRQTVTRVLGILI